MQRIAADAVSAASPADIAFGTVTKASPLEIATDRSALPLTGAALLLTEAVVERKIVISGHSHGLGGLSHSHSAPGGGTGPALEGALASDAAREAAESYVNGLALPSPEGEIILSPALAAGDKVMLLRAGGGQRYAVLSRVY
ncbi:MAG: DUF2577 domain-containing protein [Clostridiales bacterium]|jgi:hypothetical protein|nr:DUF2577 domain-containing protein [Clostridiales bacterium]